MSKNGPFDLRLIVLPAGYCNFDCVFCHREGLDDARSISAAHDPGLQVDEVAALVAWLLERGMSGITISGGEPLMRIAWVREVLCVVPRLPVTIVTNGTLLKRFIEHGFNGAADMLRINLNFPSFHTETFRKLTGQHSTRPETILEQVVFAVGAGYMVNLSCVLYPGENDAPEELRHYRDSATSLRVAGIRYLLQPEAPEWLEDELAATLQLPPTGSIRRNGRVRSYPQAAGPVIEFARCEPRGASATPDGTSDVYVTTRRTVKFGLWGKESQFSCLSQLQSLIASFLVTRNTG